MTPNEPARTGDGEREALAKLLTYIENARPSPYAPWREFEFNEMVAILAAGFRRDPGWIACNERMPEPFTCILAEWISTARAGATEAENRGMTVGYFGDNNRDFFCDGQSLAGVLQRCIVRWRPLPSPPATREGIAP